MKILVTGSEGYIGKHLVKMLLEDGNTVHTLDIKGERSETHFIVDINNETFVKYGPHIGKKYDAVVHLAALVRVGESVREPYRYYDTNINGTFKLLNNVDTNHFVFASTGAASEPNSPYGFSKRAAEDIVSAMAKKFTIFRFYNVIGTDGFPPTNPDGLMSKLIDAMDTGEFRIYGRDYNTTDGTCMREYVHVNDICAAIMRSLDKPTNKVHNLAYGDPKSVAEIVDVFKKVNNVDFKVIFDRRRDGDLESCYLRGGSQFMRRSYTYEEMMRYELATN
jgi:UDP-glucose 4-epimerase